MDCLGIYQRGAIFHGSRQANGVVPGYPRTHGETSFVDSASFNFGGNKEVLELSRD